MGRERAVPAAMVGLVSGCGVGYVLIILPEPHATLGAMLGLPHCTEGETEAAKPGDSVPDAAQRGRHMELLPCPCSRASEPPLVRTTSPPRPRPPELNG